MRFRTSASLTPSPRLTFCQHSFAFGAYRKQSATRQSIKDIFEVAWWTVVTLLAVTGFIFLLDRTMTIADHMHRVAEPTHYSKFHPAPHHDQI